MLDALIIGAGIAGLTAAAELRRAGRSVQVVEARQRTGGRAFNALIDGHHVDMGPTWIWDSERAIHDLIVSLGVATFAHRDAGLDVYESDTLQRGRFARSTILSRRVDGGMQRITSALAEGVDYIALGRSVRRLVAIPGGLRAVCDGVTYEAAHVLGALPPSLVAPMVSSLDGELSSILAKVPVWMGNITKVVAVFERPFWVDRGWSGRGASTLGPMVEMHDMSGADGAPASIFGFVPETEGLDDLEGRVRSQLVRMFGAEATPVGVVIKPWWTDAHTTTPKHRSDPRLFGHSLLRMPRLGGRLHLISCETSKVSPGHLNGAVERALAVSHDLKT